MVIFVLLLLSAVSGVFSFLSLFLESPEQKVRKQNDKLIGDLLVKIESFHPRDLGLVKYSPDQLESMVASGDLPFQGDTSVVMDERMRFDICGAAMEKLKRNTGIPSVPLVSVSPIRIRKFYYPDGVLLIACGKDENGNKDLDKIVVLRAGYN